MNNDALTFYEELKDLRDTMDVVNKVTKRIAHAEEALLKSARGFNTELVISHVESLSWREYSIPGQEWPSYRIFYMYNGNEKPLRECKIAERLEAYKHLLPLIKLINKKIKDIIESVNLDPEPAEGLDKFEPTIEEIMWRDVKDISETTIPSTYLENMNRSEQIKEHNV